MFSRLYSSTIPDRMAVRRIAVTATALSGRLYGAEMQFFDCAANALEAPARSTAWLLQATVIDLFPCEYVRRMSYHCDADGAVCWLSVETSCRRSIACGIFDADRPLVALTAPHGNEICGFELSLKKTLKRHATDRAPVAAIRPELRRLVRVPDDKHKLQKMLAKVLERLRLYGRRRSESERAFTAALHRLMDALVQAETYDAVASPSAYVATFYEILRRARHDVSHHSLYVHGLAFSGLTRAQRQRQVLTKLTMELTTLLVQVTRAYSPAALINLLVYADDLPRLRSVVRGQGELLDQTDVQVLKASAVPVVGLALEHRRLAVLQWLLFGLALNPREEVASEPAARSLDELLEMRPEEKPKPAAVPRSDDTAETTTVAQDESHTPRELAVAMVTSVGNARDFRRLAVEYVMRGVAYRDIQGLVGLMTSALDLRWILALVGMLPARPEQRTNETPHTLVHGALRHVLDNKLVLDDASVKYFPLALDDARDRGLLDENDHRNWMVEFITVQAERAKWVRAIQRTLCCHERRLNTLELQQRALHTNLQHLRTLLAERARSDLRHLRIKQLVSLVSLLLPMAVPAMAFLDHWLGSCDPMELYAALLGSAEPGLAFDACIGAGSAPLRSVLASESRLRASALETTWSAHLVQAGIDPVELLSTLRAAAVDAQPHHPAGEWSTFLTTMLESVQRRRDEMWQLACAHWESSQDDDTADSSTASDAAPSPAWYDRWVELLEFNPFGAVDDLA